MFGKRVLLKHLSSKGLVGFISFFTRFGLGQIVDSFFKVFGTILGANMVSKWVENSMEKN